MTDALPSVRVSDFDRWVAENNIPDTFEYGKGWWDYVELIRTFSAKFDIGNVRVIGHYIVKTPPPEEDLPMPAVALETESALLALKYDFGALSDWPMEWTASIRTASPYRGPTFGLFDPTLDLRARTIGGMSPDFVFGSYWENAAEFSCQLKDEWDVATMLRLVLNRE